MTKQCVLKEEDISTEFNAYETLPVYRYLDRIYACNQGNDSAIEEFEKGSIYLLSPIIFYLGNYIELDPNKRLMQSEMAVFFVFSYIYVYEDK